MWSRRAQCLVFGAIVTAIASGCAAPEARQDKTSSQAQTDMPAPLSTHSATLESRIEAFSSPVDPSISLQFHLKQPTGARAERIIAVTQQSLRTLGAWFGRFPYGRLTVVEAPWHSPYVGAAYPGAVVASTRWIAIQRDGSNERALIAAVAREYFVDLSQHAFNDFEEGLARYAAARAIDVLLEGRQYWSRRYLGGFVPVAVRSLPLSPPRSGARGRRVHFDELASTPAVTHVMLALQTLERYIGWPALQQGLAAYREQYHAGGGTPDKLLRILNEQGGRDLSPFFSALFRPGARFDYRVATATTTPSSGKNDVRVSLRRDGDAVIGVPYALHFADGTSIRETWSGRDQSVDLQYLAPSPLTSAQVDPDVMLVLDADRTNNTRSLIAAPVPMPADRGLASWIVWLQDLMLTCSALS